MYSTRNIESAKSIFPTYPPVRLSSVQIDPATRYSSRIRGVPNDIASELCAFDPPSVMAQHGGELYSDTNSDGEIQEENSVLDESHGANQ